MAEDWAAIAADVRSAIASVGAPVTVTRQISPEPATPWDAVPIETTTFSVMAVDMGIRRRRQGESIVEARVLLVAPGDIVPEIGDMVTVRDGEHAVMAVSPTAPGGVDVMFKVELQL